MLLSSILSGVGALIKGFLGRKIGQGIGKLSSKLLPAASAFGLNYLNSRALNAHLTGAQQEQNNFNAEQAAVDRNFQAEQAHINRDFQAEQAATQWQRGVTDMQAAGLNPALAYGQGGATAMQGSTPSGAMASGSNTNFATSLSDILQLSLLEKQGKMMDEEIRGKQLENENLDIENMLKGAYGAAKADAEIRSIEQSINESIAKMGEASTRSALNSAMAELTRVQTSNENIKAAELQWRKNFIAHWNMPPELAGDLAKAVATLAGAGIMSASSVIKFFSGRKGQHTRSITEKQADGTTITDTFSGFGDW